MLRELLVRLGGAMVEAGVRLRALGDGKPVCQSAPLVAMQSERARRMLRTEGAPDPGFVSPVQPAPESPLAGSIADRVARARRGA